MREILFRGKRLDNGEWVEGYYAKANHIISEKEVHVIFHTDLTLFPHSEFSSYEEVDPTTVGQYTGLKDKNGQRIFEGDILKENYRVEGKHVLHEVAFGESSFGTKRFVSGKLSDVCIPFDDCENSMCAERETEVIGNIHDNPKLFEEAK